MWNKIAIGFGWLRFNRCAAITNIKFNYTDWKFLSIFQLQQISDALLLTTFRYFFILPSFLHSLSRWLVFFSLAAIRRPKSSTCDYRFCDSLHTCSRILTILYIHTNILIIDWISVGVFFFFSFSFSMHLLLEIFLLNYPKVSVENEIYWILFDWAYGNSCPCWYIEFSV